MDDLISRQAAINTVRKSKDKSEAHRMLIQLPSAQPEQRWIPCSERIPEKYGEYRITWTTSASEKRFVGDCEYEVYSEWDAVRGGFKGQWLLEDYIKAYPDVHVIAWKPLEEPYRPEGEKE